jgi:hypothetical protein
MSMDANSGKMQWELDKRIHVVAAQDQGACTKLVDAVFSD